MPEYKYKGVAKDGRPVDGTLIGRSEDEVRMLLRRQGVRPRSISKSSVVDADLVAVIKEALGIGGTVPGERLIAFARQLNLLISAGVPLVQSLELLAEQEINSTLKNILVVVREKVAAGAYFWEALSKYPRAFERIFISMVRAGETSGNLDEMLKRLAKFMEENEKIKKLLRGAMIYPLVVTGVAIAVITLMMIFVIPKFEAMLTQAGQELPLMTQIVITISRFMVNNSQFILVGTFGLVYLVYRFAATPEGKATYQRLAYHLPLFGDLMRKSGVARFSRTMSTLLASAVNLLDAIDICRLTVDNVVIEDYIAKMRSEIEKGKTLAAVIYTMPVFPKMAVQMISVGEQTGNLDRMLEKVADIYEDEVEEVVGNITKLIEPFMLVFLGGTVAVLLVSMYLPIFKLAGAN